MKRVVIFRNGTAHDGKVFLVTNSLDELLVSASDKFGVQYKRFFTKEGGEIDDIKLIKDDDILYVSDDQDFVKPTDSEANKENKKSVLNANPMNEWILLNIGGKIFSTTRSTLVAKEPNSMLARMFAIENENLMIFPSPKDKSGAFLIDRSPEYFEPILGYLRHGQLIVDRNVNPQGVLEEAKFYGITSLIPELESMIIDEIPDSTAAPLTRRDVINAIVKTATSSELRFQGVNLAGADLSRLDLSYINFKYANLKGARLQGANLSYCCLERADLSSSNIEGATLFGCKMVCANLENCNLRGTNMEEPHGNRTNMEGVNLKGANLEGSQMAGVNLRVATLKNANLQNCDLRGAVLAGADLENCDLSGSDLHEANLRGANLKGAAFELMLTPLHMSYVAN
ncbi:BTB/POZ domain-containing protein KCTD9-like [Oppia nitens]|nr:BTB/POZ domain-containing protein KCTD9-like [Oppia nitens]XP_054167126.1 BTB/POZ domain-containing protein KCTD9-like [Oppia nitens]